MRQMPILSTTEWDMFESPPVFNSTERHRYLHLSQGLNEILVTLRTQANQVHFLLSLGYFRATGRFFAGKYQPSDVEYVASKLSLLPGMVDISGYDLKATASRHRKLVLDYLGFRGRSRARTQAGNLYDGALPDPSEVHLPAARGIPQGAENRDSQRLRSHRMYYPGIATACTRIDEHAPGPLI